MVKIFNGFEKSFLTNLLMFALLCSLLAATAGCGGDAEADLKGSSSTTTAATTAKYTVMVYMVGSDLESGGNAGTTDLTEMMQVGSDDNLTVIVETGGANKDGWRTVKRRLINQGSETELSDLGNLNMGNPDTLQDFIEWGIENYPAEKYVLVMWDHGGGAIGLPHPSYPLGTTFGNDENNSDGLSMPEIKQALRNAYITTTTKFEVIGFDACLMATIETAYTVSPYAGYLVASEEVEPGHGWDYTAILSALKAYPDMSGDILGQVIADGYQAHAEETGDSLRSQGETYDFDKSITLSVIDLSKISSVITSLESLAVAAETDLENTGQTAWIEIAGGRSKAEDYGAEKKGEGTFDMADLKHIAQNLTSTYSSQATALVSAINQAVIYKVNGAARPNSSGLSIFLPYKNINNEDVDLNAMITAYNNINFSATWRDFVSSYSDIGNGDHTAPTFIGETLTGSTFSAQVQGNDVDNVSAVVSAQDPDSGAVTIIGMVPVEIDDNGNVNYTWTGQWVTMNGEYISMILEDENDDVATYTIPAKLNGEEVNILVMYDKGSEEYSILGAWPGIENGVAAREIIAIKEGDVITPLWLTYDPATDEEGYTDGGPITVAASGVQLDETTLPSGTYNLFFIVEDYAQNEQESDDVAVTVP